MEKIRIENHYKKNGYLRKFYSGRKLNYTAKFEVRCHNFQCTQCNRNTKIRFYADYSHSSVSIPQRNFVVFFFPPSNNSIAS